MPVLNFLKWTELPERGGGKKNPNTQTKIKESHFFHHICLSPPVSLSTHRVLPFPSEVPNLIPFFCMGAVDVSSILLLQLEFSPVHGNEVFKILPKWLSGYKIWKDPSSPSSHLEQADIQVGFSCHSLLELGSEHYQEWGLGAPASPCSGSTTCAYGLGTSCIHTANRGRQDS